MKLQQEESKKLPPGWISEEISNVGEILTGNTPPKKKKEYYSSEDIEFIKPTDLQNKEITTFREKISESARGVARLIKPEGVLVTCIGEIGRVGLVKKEIAFNQQINGIQPNDKILGKFLFYRLQIEKKQIEEMSSATTVSIVNKSKFSRTKITYPSSIEEQQEIVSAIETEFSRLDDTIENLKSIKKKIKIYRQAILKKSFDGKLISFDYDKFKDKLSNKSKINQTIPTNYVGDEKEVSFVPMKDVEERTGKMNLNEIRKFGKVKKGYTRFKEGDIIFAKITPCMENGKIALAENLSSGVGCGSTEYHVISANEGLDPRYLLHFLLQPHIRKEGKKFMKGTSGHMRLRQEYLENLEISVPEIKIQKKIVEEIESKFSVIDNIEKIVNQSLKKAERLRKSILKVAFEGKLIKQGITNK